MIFLCEERRRIPLREKAVLSFIFIFMSSTQCFYHISNSFLSLVGVEGRHWAGSVRFFLDLEGQRTRSGYE